MNRRDRIWSGGSWKDIKLDAMGVAIPASAVGVSSARPTAATIRVYFPDVVPGSWPKPRRVWPGQLWSYVSRRPLEVTCVDAAEPHLTRVSLSDGNTVSEHGMPQSADWLYIGKAGRRRVTRTPICAVCGHEVERFEKHADVYVKQHRLRRRVPR
jgi:hypothetical protein